MDLWIRSQNREVLAKIDNLNIYSDNEGYTICGDKLYFDLGIYKTKERALEVLDEIHQRLIDLQALEITKDYRYSKSRPLDIVYIMPKE